MADIRMCPGCEQHMEPVIFHAKMAAPGDYHMYVEDMEQIRAYKMYECTNPICGLLQMFRDHSKDRKVEPGLKLNPPTS